MANVVSMAILLLVLGVGAALLSEGLWGAALMFFNIVFAGLIAFNFYEPAAAFVAANASMLSGSADVLCLLGLFTVAVLILRLTTDSLGPLMVRFPIPIYQLGRFVFGMAGAAVLAAILILGLEAAPVNKKVLGVIDYKFAPPFGWGFDRQWLGFFQYSTGHIFARRGSDTHDPFVEFGDAHVFDPRAEWLIRHQEARPYGTDSILSEGPSGEAEASGEASPGPP
jgi:hypothetical protein